MEEERENMGFKFLCPFGISVRYFRRSSSLSHMPILPQDRYGIQDIALFDISTRKLLTDAFHSLFLPEATSISAK